MRFLDTATEIARGDLTRRGQVTSDVLVSVVDAINVMVEELKPHNELDYGELNIGVSGSYALVEDPVTLNAGLYGALVVANIEAELTRLLSAEQPGVDWAPLATPRLAAAPLQLPEASAPGPLGVTIARAMHRVVRP